MLLLLMLRRWMGSQLLPEFENFDAKRLLFCGSTCREDATRKMRASHHCVIQSETRSQCCSNLFWGSPAIEARPQPNDTRKAINTV